MAYSSISDDIEVIPGTYSHTYTASGAITAGMLVKIAADETVEMATISAAAVIGVAAQDATDGNPVGVYPIGNMVRTRISGTATAGTPIMAGASGYAIATGWDSGNKIIGTVVKAAASDKATGIVMLE